ncbi:MAG: hypothetical protein AAGI71_19310 [Bacteroidota bacterium]
MRCLTRTGTLVILLLSIVGCHNHDPEAEALQAEAVALHDSLVVIENQVRDALALMTLGATPLEADTLQPATPLLDSLDAIEADLATWSSYLVEPAGAHEDHDDHDHDHDHDHSPAPDVTPQQMVELQQALLDDIVALQGRLEQLNLDAVSATPAGAP